MTKCKQCGKKIIEGEIYCDACKRDKGDGFKKAATTILTGIGIAALAVVTATGVSKNTKS